MVINEFPITHCSCLLLCQMSLTPLLLLIPAVVGIWGWAFPSLPFFVPQAELIYSSRQGTGHTLPWESWPKGLALAFGATWKAVVSLALSHECWWLLRHLLIKTLWWGENLLLWERWTCQIWNELGLFTVNIHSTKPVLWGFSHCLRTPWLLKILWSHMPPKEDPEAPIFV